MEANIHLARIGKTTRVFHDNLIEDNGIRLRTSTVIPVEYRHDWSQEWQKEGMIPGGRIIYSVKKFLFYHENFAIMEILDCQDRILGHYVDIVSLMQKASQAYLLTDLFLDIWIDANGHVVELDWEEFESACREGLLNSKLEITARATMMRLKKEIHEGKFPAEYIV